MEEYEINLENLVKMKRVFEVRRPSARQLPRLGQRTNCAWRLQPCLHPCIPPCTTSHHHVNADPYKPPEQEADEDGSGELDPDEFYEQLGPYLGEGLPPAAVSQLFMRIDADCGGTIDWQVRQCMGRAGMNAGAWTMQAAVGLVVARAGTMPEHRLAADSPSSLSQLDAN